MPQPWLWGLVVSSLVRKGGEGMGWDGMGDEPEREAVHDLSHGVAVGEAAEHGG